MTTSNPDGDESNRANRTSEPDEPSEARRTNRTNWRVEYDGVEPIRLRDPVAEALAVLEPGDPFVISYADVVKAAGHSCPTAAGAYRIAQLGLERLYPGALPVRGGIAVSLPGPRTDATYGVTSRLLSYITGATAEDGFGGLAGGYGNRRGLLSFEAFEAATAAPTVRLRRTDADETLEVTYRASEVPGGGPALAHLSDLVEGSASETQRTAFREAWHARVETVLTDDDLFAVSRVDRD